MIFKLKDVGVKIFSLWWALLIAVGYLGYHTYSTQSFSTPYWPILLCIAIISGWNYYLIRKNRKKLTLTTRPIYLVLVFHIISAILLILYWNEDIDSALGLSQVMYFSLSSLINFLALILLFFSCYFLGRFLSPFLKIGLDIESKLIYTALGVALLIMAGFVLGYFGFFKFYLLWPIVLIGPLYHYKESPQALKTMFFTKINLDNFHWSTVPISLILLIVMAINWVRSMKGFPMGFDGSTEYMNIANLLAESGTLPTGGQAFNWSIFMATGATLFNSTTIAILCSHAVGILCLITLFVLVRKWLNVRDSIFVAAVVVVSSHWTFLSSLDEKIDLGLLFMSLAMILLFLKINQKERSNLKWINWAILGLGLGCCLGIKYTSIILLISVLLILFFNRLGFRGYLFALLNALGIGFIGGLAKFGYIYMEQMQSMIIGILLILAGWTWFYFVKEKDKIGKLFQTIKIYSFVGLGVAIAVIPWGLKHQLEYGFYDGIHILNGKNTSILQNAPNETPVGYFNRSPNDFFNKGSRGNSQLISFQENKEGKEKDPRFSKGWRDIRRFLGYEPPLLNYASLPFDLTYNNNLPNTPALDVGFAFLVLLPFLFLLFLLRKWWQVALAGIGLVLFSIIGIYDHSFLETDNSSIWTSLNGYLTWIANHNSPWQELLTPLYGFLLTPLKLLFPLGQFLYTLCEKASIALTIILLVSVFITYSIFLKKKLSNWNYNAKIVGMIIGTYILFWVILGNGITWYGLIIWVVLPSFIIYQIRFLQRLEKTKFVPYWSFSVLGLFLLINTCISLINTRPGEPASSLFIEPFIKHFTDPRSTQEDILKNYNYDTYRAVTEINSAPYKKIYVVNTSFKYHIDQNNARVFEDGQLSQFSKNVIRFSDGDIFLKDLKQKRFGYILVDLNTPSIDRTKSEVLKKQFSKFLQVLTKSTLVELSVTDNYVQDPNAAPIKTANGQTIKARQGIVGKTALRGSFVLYKIR